MYESVVLLVNDAMSLGRMGHGDAEAGVMHLIFFHETTTSQRPLQSHALTGITATLNALGPGLVKDDEFSQRSDLFALSQSVDPWWRAYKSLGKHLQATQETSPSQSLISRPAISKHSRKPSSEIERENGPEYPGMRKGLKDWGAKGSAPFT